MNVTDLRREFDRQASDIPDLAALRAEAARRTALRARRRRMQALIAAAAAVVLVAGGSGLAVTALGHRSTPPAHPSPPQPVVSVPDVSLPAGSALIRHRLLPVTSPVTATPPAGLTVQTWLASPGRLEVAWVDPGTGGGNGAGTVYATAGGLSAFGEVGAGYLVTDTSDEPLILQTGSGQVTPAVSRTPITVGGRAATLQTAPTGTTDAFGYPAEQRITWQLPDGRWIHVWLATGPATATESAQSFAATVLESPQTLYRSVGIGVTLPGLTADSSANGTALAVPALWLCPPSVQPLNVGGIGSDDPTASCAVAQVLPPPAGGQSGETSTMQVDGRTVHVDHSSAWTPLPDSDLVAVFAAPNAGALTLSPADLAAAAASIRLSAGTTVTPPDGRVSQPPGAVVTSTLAPGPGDGTSGVTPSSAAAGRATTGTVRSIVTTGPALPTATTALPAADPTVALAPLPATLPFGLPTSPNGGYSSWTVAPESALVEVTVFTADGNAVGGWLHWTRHQPATVPADARAVTLAGRAARAWTEATGGGPVPHLLLALADGSALDVYGDAGADEPGLATLAGLLLPASTLPAVTLPTRGAGRFGQARASFTVGLAGSTPDGPAAGSAQAPAALPDSLTSAWLCPPDEPLALGTGGAGCLAVLSDLPDSDVAGQASTVTTVDGRTVYVSADGRTVFRVDGGHGAVSVTAGSVVTDATTADLAAILASIPR